MGFGASPTCESLAAPRSVILSHASLRYHVSLSCIHRLMGASLAVTTEEHDNAETAEDNAFETKAL